MTEYNYVIACEINELVLIIVEKKILFRIRFN